MTHRSTSLASFSVEGPTGEDTPDWQDEIELPREEAAAPKLGHELMRGSVVCAPWCKACAKPKAA